MDVDEALWPPNDGSAIGGASKGNVERMAS